MTVPEMNAEDELPPSPQAHAELRALGLSLGRGPWIATLVLALALAAVGFQWHWVEQVGSAERDGFVAQAERILGGELPDDPYRPPLYALLTAGLSWLTGSPFVAARLLSNLCAALLPLLAFALTLRLLPAGVRGRRLGAWAAWGLVAMHPGLWTLGQHVATDAFFATLAAACLLFTLDFLAAPSPRRAGVVGALYGLAAFARGSALFLLPALAAAALLAPLCRGGRRGVDAGWRQRGLWGLAGLFGAFTVLLPRWALSYQAFGNPFHDLNYRNLAWKLYGYPDWSKLETLPYGSLREVVAEDPGLVVSGALRELSRFFSEGASALLGTPLHAVVGVGALGLSLLAWRRRPREAWLASAALIFLLGISAAFFAWGRFLLLWLPVLAAVVAAHGTRWAEIAGTERDPRSQAPRWRSALLPWAVAGSIALLVGLLAVKTFAFRLPAFVDSHPYDEVALLQQLEREHPGVFLAATTPFLDRYVEGDVTYVPDAFGKEIEQPECWFYRQLPLLRRNQVSWLVTGAVDLRSRPLTLLEASSPTSWLRPGPVLGEARAWRLELPEESETAPMHCLNAEVASNG
ncbi:MAG: glycosyltransferase family 39 protein [Acidobacteriota bacterium]